MHNDLFWFRSSRCDSSSCVEVARLGDGIVVRQSADPDGAWLAFPAASWQAFVAGLKAGDLALPEDTSGT